jgi:hypothetical protein
MTKQDSLLYHVWKGMIYRCHKCFPNQPYWENYQGRGIKVCDEWRESFETFKSWALASGYQQGLTLEREDNDHHYTPGNCRWATRTEQQRNQRRTVMIDIGGERKPLQEWCEIYDAPYHPVYYRIKKRGFDALEVLIAWSGK